MKTLKVVNRIFNGLMEQKGYGDEIIETLLWTVFIAMIAFVIILALRIKGGALSIFLIAATVAFAVYWVRELRKGFGPKGPEKKWSYEVIETDEEVLVIAEVPGPEDEVNVRLKGDRLEIKGGADFVKQVKVKKAKELVKFTYVNGILNVELKKG